MNKQTEGEKFRGEVIQRLRDGFRELGLDLVEADENTVLHPDNYEIVNQRLSEIAAERGGNVFNLGVVNSD